MAVKIRLRRMGRKKRPVYGVVAADIRSPRDGRFIEDLGRYNPIAEPAKVVLNGERILYWLSKGAQPTDTVHNLLRRDGLLLAFDMQNKGASAEEIETAVAEFKAGEAEKSGGAGKLTARQRKQVALKEEAKAVAAREAEEARIRAEAEAAARAAAEEAQRKAAEERKRKQEAEAAQAKAEQEAANAAQAAADSESAPEAASEAPEAAAEVETAATEESKAE